MLLANKKRCFINVVLHGVLVCQPTFHGIGNPCSSKQSLNIVCIGKSRRCCLFTWISSTCVYKNFWALLSTINWSMLNNILINISKLQCLEIFLNHRDTFAIESNMDCYYNTRRMCHTKILSINHSVTFRWVSIDKIDVIWIQTKLSVEPSCIHQTIVTISYETYVNLGFLIWTF